MSLRQQTYQTTQAKYALNHRQVNEVIHQLYTYVSAENAILRHNHGGARSIPQLEICAEGDITSLLVPSVGDRDAMESVLVAELSLGNTFADGGKTYTDPSLQVYDCRGLLVDPSKFITRIVGVYSPDFELHPVRRGEPAPDFDLKPVRRDPPVDFVLRPRRRRP